MSSLYAKARFFTSSPGIAHLPLDDALEVAFVGRSNSGKSSALNVLTRQRGLAKTSKTPGRTQAINYFVLGDELPPRYFVDLPGYGYAKVPDRIRMHWEQELSRYLSERESLVGMVVLVDIRRGLGELDWVLINFCESRQLPIRVLLSKADKLSRGAAMAELEKAKKTVRSSPLVTVQLFSSLKRVGVEEAYAWLDAQLPSSPSPSAAEAETDSVEAESVE